MKCGATDMGRDLYYLVKYNPSGPFRHKAKIHTETLSKPKFDQLE